MVLPLGAVREVDVVEPEILRVLKVAVAVQVYLILKFRNMAVSLEKHLEYTEKETKPTYLTTTQKRTLNREGWR